MPDLRNPAPLAHYLEGPMAIANTTTRQRTVTEPAVTLTLSPEEAAILSAILARVGGSPFETARGLSDSILVALGGQGLGWEAVQTASRARNKAPEGFDLVTGSLLVHGPVGVPDGFCARVPA